MGAGLPLSCSAHPCSVGVSRATLRERLYFSVPKQHASSRERSCPSMEATQQYESEGLTMSNLTVNRPVVEQTAAEARIPYRHPQPKESFPELVVPNAIPLDERLWVPQMENVWFRPLCLSASRGYWMNLLRVRKSGVLSRHRHPQPVHGYVIKGRWRYLEHDWTAQEGGYVYEAPGETHTLVVDEGVEEMITLFQFNGVMIYVDPDGGVLGYEDVFTKINLCRAHYEKVGLGAGFVDQFIR